jgi:F0F1-type ATP synthase assembly protein I
MQELPPAVRLVGLGWYVATCIVLGTLGGVWLDRKLELAPLFTLLGIFLGLAAAFVGLYRMVTEAVGEGPDSKEEG